MRHRVSKGALVTRVKLIKLMLLAGFGVMIANLAYMQLIAPSQYVLQVDKALKGVLGTQSIIHESASRGLFLDTEGRPLTTQKLIRRVQCTPRNFGKKKSGSQDLVYQTLVDHFPDLKSHVDKDQNFFQRSNYLLSVNCPNHTWDSLNRKLKKYYEDGEIDHRPGSMIHEFVSFRRHYVENNMLCHLLGGVERKQAFVRSEKNKKVFSEGDIDARNNEQKKVYARTVLSKTYSLTPHIGASVKLDVGTAGLERKFDQYLAPKIGWRHSLFSKNRSFRLEHLTPEPGKNILLTIDKLIQFEAQKQLQKIKENFDPVAAAIMVVHPKSGQIVAMAGFPDFNLNDISDHGWGLKKDGLGEVTRESLTFSAQFAPGSTFKPIVLAAALEEGVLKEGEIIDCPWAYTPGNRYPIKESNKGHKGPIPWEAIIYESSNVGTAKVAMEKLGFSKTYQYMSELGFGSTSSGGYLPGEKRGDIRRGPNSYSAVDYPRVAIGQSFSVTGVQMMMAYCALANDGNLLEAQIIKGFCSSNDLDDIKFYPSINRGTDIFSSKTCDLMIGAMRGVVENRKGTGKKAKMENHTVAGKTGTAQILSPTANFIVPEDHYKFTGSFIGFFPASTPKRQIEREKIIDQRYAVGVWVYAPSKKGRQYYGGQVAAPAFKEMCEHIARIYHIPSDIKEEVETL